MSAAEYFRADELATLVQSGESALTVYRDAFERGNVAATQPGVATYRDAFNRGAQVDLRTGLESNVGSYRGPFKRKHVARTGLESNVGSYRDAFERANPPSDPVASSPVGSGTEIEWPQIGIGLGARHHARARPLAGDADHADPAARSLIRVTSPGPEALRPPSGRS
jgi:hypothetical protein